MRTPANDGGGHHRPSWRGRDDRNADAEERAGQNGGAESAGSGDGPAGPRGTGSSARRGLPPHDRSGWEVAGRAALGRRQQLRPQDRGDGGAARGPDPDPGSVFAPEFTRAGPDPAQPNPGQREAAGILRTATSGAPPPRSWYESATAAKGPVRGYPPAPGQPQPLYPPGEFGAWNRRHDHGPGRGAPAGPAGAPFADGDPAKPGPGAGQFSRYFAGDTDAGVTPGYPTLAVSDPAADVTSTQTWSALEDGRATGIWAAPAGLRGPAADKAARGRRAAPPARPDAGQQPSARLAVSRPTRPGGAAVLPGSATAAPNGAAASVADPAIGAGADPLQGPRRVSGRHGGAQSRPREASPANDPRDTPAKRQAGRSRRSRPASVRLAIAIAAILILAAAGTLGYTVLRSALSRPSPLSNGRNAASASPSPSLGPYGDIATRQTDPQPLTLAELYPASFSIAGATVASAATSLGSTCGDAIVGATLQSAVGAAGCTQVARATYVDPAGIMATIGVLNLPTGDAAKSVAQSADASDYISQLAAASGPAQHIGQGTGIEQAAAKGHYLILIWAELTSQATPSSQQTAQIESFMTALLQNTVNHDLTTRMLTGAP